MYYTRVKTKKQGVFVKKSKILHKYAEKNRRLRYRRLCVLRLISII